MMARFWYDDIVRVSEQVASNDHRKGWVIAVFDEDARRRHAFDRFAPGVVYTLEFEDGMTDEFHESDLDTWTG